MRKNPLPALVAGMFTKSRVLLCLIFFGVSTLLFLLNYLRFVGDELAHGEPAKYMFYFIMETTGAYTILLLLPFIFWMVRKFPLKRDNLLTHIPIHILASMIFGAGHTLLMYGSRTLIFRAANMETYDYGRLIYRFPMEYSHQFITYGTIFAVYILIKNG